MAGPFYVDPIKRATTYDGEAVELWYGGHLVSPTVNGDMPGPISHESVSIVFADGGYRNAELPREWRAWSDEKLVEMLPQCRVFSRCRKDE